MAIGRKTGGRQRGTPNKSTLARRQERASALAQASAAVMAGVDLSSLEGITGLQVMRMAMAAHLKAGDLDKAAAWGKEIAPYESAKLATIDARLSSPDGGPVQVRVEDVRSRIAGKLASIATRGDAPINLG